MFHHSSLDRDLTLKTYFNWFLLSFLSGTVNAGGWLAFGRFVTHVTGFATLFGIDAANGKWEAAIGISTVPIFFLMGVMISAYLVDRRIHHGTKPHYALVMGLVASCLFTAGLAGHYDFFGAWGEALKLRRDYFFLALLCMASGLQNAAITTSSGATIRTTHLTGITTDLGIGLVRLFFRRMSVSKHARDIRTTWLRVGTIGSFMVGSFVGAVMFIQFHFLGFLLPGSIALYACIVAIKESNWHPPESHHPRPRRKRVNAPVPVTADL